LIPLARAFFEDTGAVGDEIEVNASKALLQTREGVDNNVFHPRITRIYDGFAAYIRKTSL
jgi:hypothetical protein